MLNPVPEKNVPLDTAVDISIDIPIDMCDSITEAEGLIAHLCITCAATMARDVFLRKLNELCCFSLFMKYICFFLHIKSNICHYMAIEG